MRTKRALPIIVFTALLISIIPVNSADSVSQSGDLILRNGPWHVGDEIEFSILVHNGGSESIKNFLQVEIIYY